MTPAAVLLRRAAVRSLLAASLALERLALRLTEPREGDRFDARLSTLLDALQARHESLQGHHR